MPRTAVSKKVDEPHIGNYGWNVTRIFADFGGALGIVRKLNEHDYPTPSETSVRMWLSRGSIPSPWMPILILAARDANITRNVFDWIREETIDPFA